MDHVVMSNGNATPFAFGPPTRPELKMAKSADTAAQRVQGRWFLRMRWAAVLAQVLTALLAVFGMHLVLPLRTIGGVILVEATSNIALWSWARGARPLSAALLLTVLAFDILVLTVLLISTGGPLNPFSCLYLVEVTLGAVLLPAPKTWALIAWSLACFGLLFAGPLWLPPPARLNHIAHSSAQMQQHMRAMWFSFAIASCFISYIVMVVRQRLAAQELELTRARAFASHSERIVSMATLATGAAHELSTPLSTIAVVANELERALADFEAARDDARSIRREVARCREILQHMIADANSGVDDRTHISLGRLLHDTLEGMAHVDRIALRIDTKSAELVLDAPARALTRAVRGVLDNALQASGDAGARKVEVEARVESDCCWIAVRNFGAGMNRELLGTKAPSQTIGLGLYFARLMVEQVGGQLCLESRPGDGTIALLTIPVGTTSCNASS